MVRRCTISKFIKVTLAGFFLSCLGVEATAQGAPLEIPWVKEWASSAHAMSSAEAFNHWNEEGAVSGTCARCHTTTGFQDYIGADGSPAGSVEKDHLIGQVISCVACHNAATRELTSVTFPSGLVIEDLGAEARCMTCHQGRESTVSMNKAIGDLVDDTVSGDLRFRNIHYRAAGATRYGTQAKGGYEYDGKTYVGLYPHDPDATVCSDCHTLHTFRVDVDNCNLCHRAVESKDDFADIRRSKIDYNGNGDLEEGIAKEVADLHAKLAAAMLTYSTEIAGQPIVYGAHNYPYFFTDKNGDGKADASETVGSNGYKTWTPRLLKAAYNYQFVAKDPGAYTHNPHYVLQLLYDSIESLSTQVEIDMANMQRP